jgi:protein-tyrosine-phosphatase
MKLLFICQGNVGRSQIAAAYYNFFTQSDDADSAGFSLTTPIKYAMGLDHNVLAAMDEVNINIHAMRPKTLTHDLINAADKVIVLANPILLENENDQQTAQLLELHTDKVVEMFITDPIGVAEIFHVRDKIKEKIVDFINPSNR